MQTVGQIAGVSNNNIVVKVKNGILLLEDEWDEVLQAVPGRCGKWRGHRGL
jgi:hypothetical protein